MKNVMNNFLYDEGESGGSFGLSAMMQAHLEPIKNLEAPVIEEPGDAPLVADPLAEEEPIKDEIEVIKPPESDLTKLSPEELIAEITVRENKKVALDKQLQEHLVRIAELEESRAVTPAEKFVEAFKADPKKAIKDYAKDLELPGVDTLGAVLARGSVEERLAIWQDKILPKQIEKEFGLQDGEFELNPVDVFKAKTPSYRYVQLSQTKESEFKAEDAQAAKQGIIPAEQLEAYHNRQTEDLNVIAKDFFGGGQQGDSLEVKAANALAVDKVNAILAEMQAIPEKIIKGEATQDKHPFEMRNLIRGVNFDMLSDIKVNAAVNDLLQQLRERGVHIPADMPTDLSSVKPKEEKPKPKESAQFSPMLDAMNTFLR